MNRIEQIPAPPAPTLLTGASRADSYARLSSNNERNIVNIPIHHTPKFTCSLIIQRRLQPSHTDDPTSIPALSNRCSRQFCHPLLIETVCPGRETQSTSRWIQRGGWWSTREEEGRVGLSDSDGGGGEFGGHGEGKRSSREGTGRMRRFWGDASTATSRRALPPWSYFLRGPYDRL